MVMRFLTPGVLAMLVLAMFAPSSGVLARTSLAEDEPASNAQIAELYQLQIAFHSAGEHSQSGRPGQRGRAAAARDGHAFTLGRRRFFDAQNRLNGARFHG